MFKALNQGKMWSQPHKAYTEKATSEPDPAGDTLCHSLVVAPYLSHIKG